MHIYRALVAYEVILKENMKLSPASPCSPIHSPNCLQDLNNNCILDKEYFHSVAVKKITYGNVHFYFLFLILISRIFRIQQSDTFVI